MIYILLQLHERLRKELYANFITYLILLSIKQHGGRSYGYQMKQYIENLTGESVSEGTLYTLLPRLASPTRYGYLESYLEYTETNRKRRYYTLTKRGLTEINEWVEEWNTNKAKIESVIQRVKSSGEK